MKKLFRSAGKAAAVTLAVMAAIGAYDVSRNKRLNGSVVRRYFFGNGAFTWLVSPLNALLDLLALPYANKGVYTLEDLPASYRAEIQRLIDAARSDSLIERIEAKATERARTMIFFKWYGANIDAFVDIPAYHETYRYVQTIGVSVFNKKQQTSKHFGPFRPTLRVLYNINDTVGRDAYIVVGDVTHYWEDEKLFIFDDTLMHQSFNLSDQVRYCLFVDILRPSLFPSLFAAVVRCVQLTLRSVNYIFYKNWDVIES